MLPLKIVPATDHICIPDHANDKIANIQKRYEDTHYQKYHYGRRDCDEDNDDDNDDYCKRQKKEGIL
jgi:hypothetical protein